MLHDSQTSLAGETPTHIILSWMYPWPSWLVQNADNIQQETVRYHWLKLQKSAD